MVAAAAAAAGAIQAAARASVASCFTGEGLPSIMGAQCRGGLDAAAAAPRDGGVGGPKNAAATDDEVDASSFSTAGSGVGSGARCRRGGGIGGGRIGGGFGVRSCKGAGFCFGGCSFGGSCFLFCFLPFPCSSSCFSS